MAKESTKQGIGLQGILTIIFFFAKIIGCIDWSWWWVFSPMWIPFAICMTFLGGAAILSLILALLE